MYAADENLYDVYEVPENLLVILAAAGFVVVVAAILAFRRVRLRRRKLRAFDPCQHCGFDLRATTGPCPECGRPRPTPRKPKPLPKEALFDDFEDEPWHAS